MHTTAECTRTRAVTKRQWTPVPISPNSRCAIVFKRAPPSTTKGPNVAAKSILFSTTSTSECIGKHKILPLIVLPPAENTLFRDPLAEHPTSIVTVVTSDEFVLVTHSDLPVTDTADEEDDAGFVLLSP